MASGKSTTVMRIKDKIKNLNKNKEYYKEHMKGNFYKYVLKKEKVRFDSIYGLISGDDSELNETN